MVTLRPSTSSTRGTSASAELFECELWNSVVTARSSACFHSCTSRNRIVGSYVPLKDAVTPIAALPKPIGAVCRVRKQPVAVFFPALLSPQAVLLTSG